MKKGIWIGGFLFAALATQAATVADDFNRADTVSSTDTTLIGANWAQSGSLNSRWRIGSNTVYSTTTVDPGLMYNTAQQTIGGGNGSFVVSVDVAAATSNVWSGVAFNYQDDNNYYCVRFKAGTDSYQILARVGGSWSVLGSGHAASPFAFGPEAFYRLKVTSDYAYGFTVEIEDLSSSSTVAFKEAFDAGENFANGYAGLLLNSSSTNGSEFARFDNFSLETAAVGSTTFTDDFNRPDMATTNTALIGPNWHQEVDNEWLLNASNLLSHASTRPIALYNTTLETISGNGTNFTLTTTVRAQADNQWIGIAFNYQDSSNFYAFRFKSATEYWQLIRCVNGDVSIVRSGSATEGFLGRVYYTLTVKSSEPGEFGFTIRKAGSPVVLNAETNAVDTEANFAGGYAAAYVDTTGYAGKYDSFRLTVASGALYGYAGWASLWGVDIGAEDDDYDGDGLVNLYEYGLGGDPTNALDQGTSPRFAVVEDDGGDFFGYIYPQLSDPQSGLSYHLETCTDLARGSWVDDGYTVEGTNVTGGALDFVTNTMNMVEDQKFIRLIIQ